MTYVYIGMRETHKTLIETINALEFKLQTSDVEHNSQNGEIISSKSEC